MASLVVHIRKQGRAAFEWMVAYAGDVIAGGADASIADCLRAAASIVFLDVQHLELTVTYRGMAAGPYAAARLLGEAEEVADHLKELALER